MLKFAVLFVLAVSLLAASACKTNQGSREFIPGKGWVPTR
jgi:hypothetical protein